jgi:NAD-dependent DNA ligase
MAYQSSAHVFPGDTRRSDPIEDFNFDFADESPSIISPPPSYNSVSSIPSHQVNEAMFSRYTGPSFRITDEEGYSDDDEEADDNPWLVAFKAAPPSHPTSLLHHHVATTGTFSRKLQSHRIQGEIQDRGGIYVNSVDSNTTLLLSPHPFARSKKAHAARVLGIPIMDEASFLKLPLLKDRSNW